jgi:ribosomal protein L37AE/L43A
MKRTDFIDANGNWYVKCTRAEALAETSNPRPGLRPRSQWTRDENEQAYEHKVGEWAWDTCPVCGKPFRRRISHRQVACLDCGEFTLETRE